MESIKEINIKIVCINFLTKCIVSKTLTCENIDIYYIFYITMKYFDHDDVHTVTPLYFLIGEVDGYIDKNNGNKYLVFASTDKSKEILTKYSERLNKIENMIENINGKPGEYGKKFIKIKFDSNNNLYLNKLLKLYNLTIMVRFVFQEGNKYYPQSFLDQCLFIKCCITMTLMFQNELTSINQISKKNVWFVIIGILKILIINLNQMSVINVMIYHRWLMN